MKLLRLTLALSLLWAANCSQRAVIDRNSTAKSNWIEQTLAAMTLDQKIGQMILMTFNPTYMADSGDTWLTTHDDIIHRHVFGYHIWQGDIYAARHYIRKMQALTQIPLVFSADFERGVGLKFDGAVEFPPNMAFGAAGNPDYAYQLGAITAQEARSIGFSMVFAPVADIQNNPENPIINTRSFSESPELVAQMVTAFIKGAHDQQFGTVVKHFPGHGNTNFDSHIDLATIYSSKEALESTELVPFKAAIEAGVEMIMTAHICVPALEKTFGLPATLSKAILTGLLRQEMGYNGVIISDAMSMGGIRNNFTEKYAAVSAINAGCDLLINNGSSATFTFEALKEAVNTGRLTEARIDSSVRRLLRLKADLGLFHDPLLDLENGDRIIGQKKSHTVAQAVAERAVTLVRDERKLLPIQADQMLAIVNLHDVNTRHEINLFQSEMQQLYPEALLFNLDLSDNAVDYRMVADSIPAQATVIIGGFIRYGAYKGHIDFSPEQIAFIRTLQKKTPNIILYSFGNPYILRHFPDLSTALCGFGWQRVCQEAAVKALTGQIDITGKMPVTVPGIINFGNGVEMSKSPEPIVLRQPEISARSIRRGFPEEVHVDPARLRAIEDLLVRGVQDSAYPGGVFLAVKDGVIFEEYCFGKLSYAENSASVNNRTVYDLASLTKPCATTMAAMLLYDQGLLDLDEKVRTTIPAFNGKGKEKVTIRHLLTHTSGLPPFIRLWKIADNPQAMLDSLFAGELVYPTGTESQYSCLGMIILQKIIEAKTGQPLDVFLMKNLYQPLGMVHTFFNPSPDIWDNVAPTEYDSERGGIVHGRVHDENAYYLGGVSGNAGLFSTARDLAILSQLLINKGNYRDRQYLRTETVELFTRRQNLVTDSDRTLGWGTPASMSSAGQYFSENSIGHTGFTGTSIWIDFDKNLAGILLTNRVHPTRANHKLYDFRYKIYDLLQESLTDYPLIKNPNVGY